MKSSYELSEITAGIELTTLYSCKLAPQEIWTMKPKPQDVKHHICPRCKKPATVLVDIKDDAHFYPDKYAGVKVRRGPLNQKARQSFQAEANMIMSLDHMHVVRVFDFGIQDGTPYIIMQRAANGSLRSMYPTGTKLPLPTILHYA